MSTINQRSLKISQAKVEVSKDLPIGTYDVEVLVKGDIVKEEYTDNQDGTRDVTYILKAYEVEVDEQERSG